MGREGQFFELAFERPVLDVLDEEGHVPLPPYIEHEDSKNDETRYQTVYAQYPGAWRPDRRRGISSNGAPSLRR